MGFFTATRPTLVDGDYQYTIETARGSFYAKHILKKATSLNEAIQEAEKTVDRLNNRQGSHQWCSKETDMYQLVLEK